MRSIRAVVVALTLTVALTGCGAPEVRTSEAPSPFDTCPQAAAPPAHGDAGMVPSVTLPCFTGGAPVALAGLGRPAVINLWASWCAPCRQELPEFQRLADAANDTVAVIGVVTQDTQTAAASLAEDLGITFPTLFDSAAQLQRSVAPLVLPITLFVDAGGRLRHVHTTGALTLSTLERLTREYLGVTATGAASSPSTAERPGVTA
jgi:thiol-disulfide isomerase/thioredoxin